MENPEQTASRKRDHVDLVVGSETVFNSKTTGLEHYDFVHCALPETDYYDVSTTATFLSKTISAPLMISAMTGGYPEAESINAKLAEVCESENIAMGLGSMRQLLLSDESLQSYAAARLRAPTIPLTANVGASQIVKETSTAQLLRLCELVSADALTIHLNAAQELLQSEGEPFYRGVLGAIERVVRELPLPVIVKEVGSGIGERVARQLLNCGVSCIDVAGAGGTSWAAVEIIRAEQKSPQTKFSEDREFWNWGLPTSRCLVEVNSLRGEFKFCLIGSGGITSGMEVAKCLALGADIVGSARPFLLTLVNHGQNALREQIASWRETVKRVVFLTGAQSVGELRYGTLIKSGS